MWLYFLLCAIIIAASAPSFQCLLKEALRSYRYVYFLCSPSGVARLFSCMSYYNLHKWSTHIQVAFYLYFKRFAWAARTHLTRLPIANFFFLKLPSNMSTDISKSPAHYASYPRVFTLPSWLCSWPEPSYRLPNSTHLDPKPLPMFKGEDKAWDQPGTEDLIIIILRFGTGPPSSITLTLGWGRCQSCMPISHDKWGEDRGGVCVCSRERILSSYYPFNSHC
jgi:hypothetical protein